MINKMHMKHTFSFSEALEIADSIVGENSKIIVMPDEVSIISKK